VSDRYGAIYRTRAAEYHRLIAAEDVDGHLAPALRAVAPVAGATWLDVGSGTGRLPILLGGEAARVVALDAHAPMLVEQRRVRGGGTAGGDGAAGASVAPAASGGEPLDLVTADARALPFAETSFDLVTAGWALGHFCAWFGEAWPAEIGRALGEMRRVARPGATLVLLETLGTGTAGPGAPRPDLADYYAWLEGEHGFARRVVTTDYEFADAAEAGRLVRFFFGDPMADRLAAGRTTRLPEWTGIWHRRV
jgi:ubiquinone/menaquinone biosynthesis C-methylase UbiE